ncbi:Phosphotransferase enzyme family protein [Micromonospora mirobrigensis]|uniref:Phosphotransferase enzyme family protein n=1 Tax=Micromonospora mirobrigensis TaxID=262898 RepID=A0A1C4VS35_9ACTN|nr:Phosphotransferase enzyme family protein [Micromonospora mirobrigensis]
MGPTYPARVTEEPLSGGHNAHEVVRIGGTVHRRGDGNTFAVRVLRHLEAVGYPYAPRHLGVDEQGRDMLTYIPGVTTDHPGQRAVGAYALGGRMLRDLHDATAGHALAAGRDCVLHGDPGPFNTIFRAGLPVAFIDWDSCRPGDRLDDLGYLAWTWCVQSQGNVPIDDQARHLRELRDGYGDVGADTLIRAILRRQTELAEVEAANAADPRHGAERRRHAEWAVQWATGDRELFQRHEDVFLAALG